MNHTGSFGIELSKGSPPSYLCTRVLNQPYSTLLLLLVGVEHATRISEDRLAWLVKDFIKWTSGLSSCSVRTWNCVLPLCFAPSYLEVFSSFLILLSAQRAYLYIGISLNHLGSTCSLLRTDVRVKGTLQISPFRKSSLMCRWRRMYDAGAPTSLPIRCKLPL